MTLFISVQNCSFSKAQFVLPFNIDTGRPNKIWKGKIIKLIKFHKFRQIEGKPALLS